MRIVDSHVHIWSIAASGHDWPTPAEAAIHRDFDLGDYREATAGVPVSAAILVQAQPHTTETARLLATAADSTIVAGVVGWTDLAAPDAPARIAALARDPLLKGLRPMLQALPDTQWLRDPALAPALTAMCDHGLRLDALVQPRHLPMLVAFARDWPALPIVIDHGGKPDMRDGAKTTWRDDIARLADAGLHCKLSGLRSEPGGDEAESLAAVVGHLASRFDRRLMWGSDWPVVTMAHAGWHDWLRDARALIADDAAPNVFAGCAAEFYDITA